MLYLRYSLREVTPKDPDINDARARLFSIRACEFQVQVILRSHDKKYILLHLV